jgi:hypothetical protein
VEGELSWFCGEKMYYKPIAISVCLLALLISSCLKRDSYQEDRSIQTQNPHFFVPIPLTFSPCGSPYLDVEIDNQTFSMKFDLGLRGDLIIENTFIDQILSKQFIRSKPMYGFRGKEYQTNLYRIPKITIGAISFTQPILQENCEEARKDSVIVQTGEDLSSPGAGKIGWELFCNIKVLVDMKNSQVAFCDNLNTLKKYGYSIDDFVKIPLLTERGLVEFEAKTINGSLRCVLDTGTTWNILNAEIEEGKSIEQVIFEPSNILEYPSFAIDEKEFGPVAFHQIPIKIPIQIEAILGMEFFADHLIFLDFVEKAVYFKKSKKLHY